MFYLASRACVSFLFRFSCVHSRVGKVNVTRGLSLLLSLSVASGFLLGSALFGVTTDTIEAREARPSLFLLSLVQDLLVAEIRADA